ncbi:MAG TPA: ABC transporter substrate-binding protein [Bradyrhizobium sp.]|nr:ABC transporter substrate-binding protein [Bradyrhizobium sp.]
MPSDQNRREFLGLLTAIVALAPLDGQAQVLPKRVLIGFLGAASKAAGERYYSGFPLGMRELGYVEGRDYEIIDRYADGDLGRLPLLAEELVRVKPSVIVTSNSPAALAAKQATSSVPIICGTLRDYGGLGLHANDARPDANVTGIRVLTEGLTAKLLEIALDLVPGITKIALLLNISNPSTVDYRQEAGLAAAKLGVTLVPIEVHKADEIAPAFQTILHTGADILIVSSDATFVTRRRQISALALASRLPTIYSYREHVEDGGLVSYGANLRQNFRRAAYYVDRILKGAKVVDLPVEFPTSLELVINLATARALSLTIPPALLARADEVLD